MQGNAPDEEHIDPHGECRIEIDALRDHIATLLRQLSLFPVKHPQQSDERNAAHAAITGGSGGY